MDTMPGMNVQVDEAEDTEFNDALRKHGIIPQKEAPPPSPSTPPSPSLDDLLDDFTYTELQELQDDAPDDEAERTIAEYRRQRIAEAKQQEKLARFGRVYPIGREDYTREITEASKVDEEGDEKEQGTGVVVFLYKDGIPRSDRAKEHLNVLSARYPRTKFVSIVGNKCIQDLPDIRVPMLIVYKKGEIRTQVTAWGEGRDTVIEEMEALLMVSGAIEIPERRRPGEAKKNEGDDSEDESDNESRSRATGTNGRAPKNIRNSKKDDSDSDFEFDI